MFDFFLPICVCILLTEYIFKEDNTLRLQQVVGRIFEMLGLRAFQKRKWRADILYGPQERRRNNGVVLIYNMLVVTRRSVVLPLSVYSKTVDIVFGANELK